MLVQHLRYCRGSVGVVGFLQDPYGIHERKTGASLAELERKDPPPGDLKDLIDHWVHAIGSWVQDFDQGLGGAADGAGPAAMLDSAPEPTRATPPAVDAG
jgi:hypothetical protein